MKKKQNKGEKFYQIEQNLPATALHNNQASRRNTIATQPSKRLLQIKNQQTGDSPLATSPYPPV